MILSADDLRWYREKDCILLDGAFDPLHAGHIAYFTAAVKAFPSRLMIVAVASDDDIRAKGREPLLDQQTRCQLVAGMKGIDLVVPKSGPTEHLICQLKPGAYVKGKDWEGRLPQAQLMACALHDAQIVYLDTVCDSSTDRLRRWARQDAEASLDRLEAFMAAQAEAPPANFDREYFQGAWRQNGNVYDYDTRSRIEGDHPDRIVACFPQMSVLDVGCGPGYLVRLLKERGVNAGGCDTSAEAVGLAADRTCVHIPVSGVPPNFADVVICREVLEHVPVADIPEMVCDLFRVARRFVYITTRFSDGSVFDAATDFETDPTHISLLSQPFLRSLCVLNGGKRRRDLETTLDHMGKGRVLVYQVAQ